MTRFPAGVPLLHDYLENSARRVPERTAVVTPDSRLSYSELNALANGVAHWLRDHGVRGGDRVLVFGPSSAEAVAAFWGTLKADAVASVINPQTRAEKLGYLFRDAEPSGFIADGRLSRFFLRPLGEKGGGIPALLWGVDPDDSEGPGTSGGAHVWRRVIPERSGPFSPQRTGIDVDLASIIYTSGSTGSPKGVMLTHRNMLTAARSVSSYLEMEERDVVLNLLPLSFDYGLYQLIMAARVGATVVLEPSFAFPARILDVMEREAVTGFPGVPTIFATLAGMKDPGPRDLSHVRFITNTAAHLSTSNIEFLRKAFPRARIYPMYGITECQRISFLPPADLDRKPGSVGVPIPNTEVWIADDNGNRLGPDQVGEVVVRGATVMAGYWGDPEETRKKLRPGPVPGERFLFTGDLARMDEEGYLYFVGRMDDILKVKGEKVAPKEVEDAISRVPGVREVAVIGVPDEVMGRALHAFVVPAPNVQVTKRDVLRGCRERLEPFMIPQKVRFLSDLPRSPHGKVDRKRLLDIGEDAGEGAGEGEGGP